MTDAAPPVRGGIVILDYGSQFTQLIARRIRELHVYCDILPASTPPAIVRERRPDGIVLSGGPASVFDPEAPPFAPEVLGLGVPVLGICYGMQLMAAHAGADVRRSPRREYGRATVTVRQTLDLFAGFEVGEAVGVWMNHGDTIHLSPSGFVTLADSPDTPVAAFAHPERRHFGVQFHPEVVHTPRGGELLRSFAFVICGCTADWTPTNLVAVQVDAIRRRVGSDQRVICGLSGGVDSAVAATIVHRAVGSRLSCIFVDHGLLRRNERKEVETTFRREMGVDLRVIDARERFFARLEGVDDPEEKRRRIGHTFIDVFEEASAEVSGDVGFLVQGTLYPDVIESTSPGGGPSATIKTHHNVGGLRPNLPFALIEPLRDLFKDEVRAVGRELGLGAGLVGRHPFPGPGLAVRVLGAVTEELVAMVRAADAIFLEEIRSAGLYDQIWQAFAVLLPVRSVGVMGDHRTYDQVIALRAVTSHDGMTADWFPLPVEVLAHVATRITNEVRGVNRVVYDVSSKPPSTIEWE